MTEVFTWDARVGAQGDVNQSALESRFGDGYAQALAVGINNSQQSWALTFTGKQARMQPIKDFFDRHKGAASFIWTPPLGEPGLYRCKGYKIGTHGRRNFTLSATFEQWFAP
ncbi:phage tail protein [Pseudomonas sp. NPDC086581]|uniref:phage tail protein n=1 Tax=Pseudomonas sp. NPDC086581 TaxID=3364432 RepID=UPI00381A406E